MDRRMSTQTRGELVRVLGRRYHDSSKMAKTLILNELVAVSGYHRKHAIRLLSSDGAVAKPEGEDGWHHSQMYGSGGQIPRIVKWPTSAAFRLQCSDSEMERFHWRTYDGNSKATLYSPPVSRCCRRLHGGCDARTVAPGLCGGSRQAARSQNDPIVLL